MAKKKWAPAVEMGKRGGARGGPARARKLSAKRRSEIATQGGKARGASLSAKQTQNQKQPQEFKVHRSRKTRLKEGG